MHQTRSRNSKKYQDALMVMRKLRTKEGGQSMFRLKLVCVSVVTVLLFGAMGFGGSQKFSKYPKLPAGIARKGHGLVPKKGFEWVLDNGQIKGIRRSADTSGRFRAVGIRCP